MEAGKLLNNLADAVLDQGRYGEAEELFAASLGLLVTGLFLHELDQPRAEELNRPVELEADVGPGHVGARVVGAF